MRKLFLIAAAVAANACSPAASPGVGLAQETAGRIAGPAHSCISSDAGQGLRVLDAQTLAYGWGRTLYINHLDPGCPGISSTSTLLVDRLGPQYCRGDRVQGLEAGASIPGPMCVLGDWVPYRKP